jgi:hypothetical protein
MMKNPRQFVAPVVPTHSVVYFEPTRWRTLSQTGSGRTPSGERGKARQIKASRQVTTANIGLLVMDMIFARDSVVARPHKGPQDHDCHVCLAR